jgi:hypothetical protein
MLTCAALTTWLTRNFVDYLGGLFFWPLFALPVDLRCLPPCSRPRVRDPSSACFFCKPEGSSPFLSLCCSKPKGSSPASRPCFPFVSVFSLPFALAFPFSYKKAEEAVSPKAQMTMNTGNFLSNVEIFIISPFLIFCHSSRYISGYQSTKHAKL